MDGARVSFQDLLIDESTIRAVLQKATSGGADFAEIFAEDTFTSRIALNDSRIKQSMSGCDSGVGIRAIYGTTVIYAYTNSFNKHDLLETAEAVACAIRGTAHPTIMDLTRRDYVNIHPYQKLPQTVDKIVRVNLLQNIDEIARSYGDIITQVDASISERLQDVLIANTQGVLVTDRRCYTRLGIMPIATEGNERQSAFNAPGAMAGFEFVENLDIESLVRSTTESAITMTRAAYAPACTKPVIIDNGFGGVIFHEACGHSLETTAIAKNASVFCGKIGEKIAHESVTAIDDGTIPNEWGSTHVDDEGRPTQRTVLIENGILKSYMCDYVGSLKTGYACTGSGRRESYRYAPTSRMRNTFIAPGKETLESLIASVDDGLYAKTMGGGSVDPATGDYNFAVQEGYLIKNGKICEPVRGATLIGNGAETLPLISGVAQNIAQAQGMCGSISGSVPTNVGQPAIRVDSMIIGGR